MTDPMTFHFNIGQIYEGISREILAVRYMYLSSTVVKLY